jgi:cellulose synthase/poly-beta-1,6-N-acetylglucosamine synthase-like glycosyltransferase
MPMTSPQPSVSVIVPVRNGERFLPSLIRAVSAQDYPAEKRELILVDNGSTDGTGRMIRDFERQGVLGAREPVRGSYRARNAGARIASGEVFAFTDVDCTPEPTWLSQGVRHMADEDIDVLAGRISQEVAGGANLFQTIEQIIYLRQSWYRTQGFGATANLFVRQEAFEAVGGFDSRLWSSGDRMLCLQAVRQGYRFGYHGEAIVHHSPRATAKALALKEVRLGYGFGQICRLYPSSGGMRFFGQTYLPIPGIRGCLEHGTLNISSVRDIMALATYALIRVPCRTYGFLRAVGGRNAPGED